MMNYFSSNSVLIQEGLPIKKKACALRYQIWGKKASLDRGVHMLDGNAAETTASTTGNLPLRTAAATPSKCSLDFSAGESTLAPMIRTDVVIVTVIGALLTPAPGRAQVNIEQIVAQKVQPILPKSGQGGGVAVAVQMNGKTSFFNYGMADNAQNRPVTADAIFNLGSVGKLL